MDVTIRVVIDDSDLRTFLGVPKHLGQQEPLWRARWVAQLVTPQTNPFLRHAEIVHLVAYNATDAPIGRVSAFLDSRADPDFGYVGLFESADDPAIANALIDAAQSWLERRGCSKIRGPLDPCSFVFGGVMVDGFDAAPMVALPVNPAYYAELLRGCGFQLEVNLLVWRYGDKPVPKQAKLISQAVAQHPGLELRKLTLERFESDLDTITDLYNQAWQTNWSYAPVDREDMRWLLQDGRWIDFDLSYLVLVDQKPIAVAIAAPNFDEYNQPASPDRSSQWLTTLAARVATKGWINQARLHGGRPDGWRQLLYGVLPEYRGGALGGLGVHLYVLIREQAAKLGYNYAETAWTTSEDQILNNGLKVLGAHRNKKYEVYTRG